MNISKERKTSIYQELQAHGLQPTDEAVNAVAALMAEKSIGYQQAVKIYVGCDGKQSSTASPNNNDQVWRSTSNAISGTQSALNQFADQVSDTLSKPVGDRIVAQTLLKGAAAANDILSGKTEPGELTRQAMALILGGYESAATELGTVIDLNFLSPSSNDLSLPPSSADIPNSETSNPQKLSVEMVGIGNRQPG